MLILRIGEIALVIFVFVFGLGFYIFWRHAWTLSSFEAVPTIPSQGIPNQRLESLIEYIDQKENAFKSPLPPSAVPDPFQPNAPSGSPLLP